MSWWGTIDAEFVCLAEETAKKLHDSLSRAIEERHSYAPTGSESGPAVRLDRLSVSVYGRLRDVTDVGTSPEVLAWFCRVCDGLYAPVNATLLWELDSGPRYRYKWRDGELRKLRGVLDG